MLGKLFLTLPFYLQVDGLKSQPSRCRVRFSTSAERQTGQRQHRLQWMQSQTEESQEGHTPLNIWLNRYPTNNIHSNIQMYGERVVAG